MITQFNSANLTLLRSKMMKAFKEIEEETGLTFKIGTMRYGTDTVKMTVESRLSSAPAPLSKVDEAKGIFDFVCRAYGMKPENRGQRFEMEGKTYEVTGIKTRSPKKPILITEVQTGKNFVTTTNTVLRGLGLPVHTCY